MDMEYTDSCSNILDMKMTLFRKARAIKLGTPQNNKKKLQALSSNKYTSLFKKISELYCVPAILVLFQAWLKCIK